MLVAQAFALSNVGRRLAAAHGHEQQTCACAQHEADHPFTIDCTDGDTIRAATLTLESDACEAPRSDEFEWGGAFETPANAYTWVSQAATADDTAATGFAYADPGMMLVAFATDEADVDHLFEKAAAANTLMTTAGSCPEVNMDSGTPSITPTTAGACVTIKFPDSSASLVDFHMTVNTAAAGHVAFFTAHMPTEFERDTHYFMSTDLNTDIEPESQNKEYCKIHADANGLKVCQQAFMIIQAHHDYCPHDTLTRYEEELFHEWESKCNGCSIVRKYDATLKNCPVIDCTDTTVAELGYEHLNSTCIKPDTSYAFEWAANFDTPANTYKWVSQAATTDLTAATNYSYADATMTFVAYAMDGNEKSKLFALKDAADTLMTTGSCPEVNMDSGTPIITPTTVGEGGACVTIKFPDSSASLVDFHMTVNTAGVAHVAFFTAHVPTEFERDTHYFMSTDLSTDIEPVETLGAAAAHDHGRRLSIATKGRRALTTTSGIGKKRRLANDGSCCNNGQQQGAWKQVVAYHDECDYDQVPPYVEAGFHDYEASCVDYFCNLVGPDVDQTTCGVSPPPPPSLPPSPPTSPAPSTGGDDDLDAGAIAGIAVAAGIAVIAVIFMCIMIQKEKAGKPMFVNMDAKQAGMA